MHRFKPVDETWIHYNTSDTKQKPEHWLSPGQLASRKLSDDLKKTEPHVAKKQVLLYQDNAFVHTCVVAMVECDEFEIRIVSSFAQYYRSSSQ